jgi:hypothetical protein
MSIFLPSSLDLLSNAFKEACKQLIDLKEPRTRTFDDPCIDLIAQAKANPLIGPYLIKLEKEALQIEEEQVSLEKEALEAIWLNFWQNNSSIKFRRELIHVKRLLTNVATTSTRPLTHQIHTALLNLYDLWTASERAFIFDDSLLNNAQLIWNKHSIEGSTRLERHENIKRKAAKDPTFCWSRLNFFQSAVSFNGPPPSPQKKLKGRWQTIQKEAWSNSLEASRRVILSYAKMGLSNLNVEINPNQFPISFLMLEHQLNRKLLQHFIKSFQSHVDAHLLRLKDQQACAKEKREGAPHTVESYIVQHGSKYWSLHPNATYAEVFTDYYQCCPHGIRREDKRWEQIIRERKVDPRDPKKKKRGAGKRTN